MKLTKVNIAKVAVPSGKSEIIEFDDDVPGFGLRVRAGGSATWIFQYRQGNKQRRLCTRAAETLGSVLRPYLLVKKSELKPRTYEEVERHLLQHSKRLHGLQLTAIDRRTVAHIGC